MSVYNGDRYLEKAVDSILAQTFKDFEFIIINDGSSDRSLSILENYAKQDDRIRLIDQQNSGLTKSLNKSLALSCGEFIARMDADDIAMPERFERQIEYLETHPQCVIVGSEVLQIDMDGDAICEMGISQNHKKIEAELLAGCGGAIRHPAAMMRREPLIAIGGYREKFKMTEDLDLFLRLAECGELANLPEVLLHYRLHLGSVNFTKAQQQTQEVIAVLEEAYKSRNLDVPVKLPSWRFKETKPIDSHRTWTQMALSAGNMATAKKHAFLALWQKPISRQSWQLLFRTLKP
jgi:glycosyltransferase involved in cell wall biosynthesis